MIKINLQLPHWKSYMTYRKNRKAGFHHSYARAQADDGDPREMDDSENLLHCEVPEVLLTHMVWHHPIGERISIGPDFSEDDECMLLRPASYYEKICFKRNRAVMEDGDHERED